MRKIKIMTVLMSFCSFIGVIYGFLKIKAIEDDIDILFGTDEVFFEEGE